MSEYMIDGTLLSNIAQGIRNVDGTTSLLTPAQMRTRLNAIKSSVDAALSAVAGKNVTVPSGSDVHDLAGLIANIVGLPTDITAIKTGVFIPASDISVTALEITHNLGVTPNFILLRGQGSFTSSMAIRGYASTDSLYSCEYAIQSGSDFYGGGSILSSHFNASTVTIYPNGVRKGSTGDGQYVAPFAAGIEYHWIIGRFVT